MTEEVCICGHPKSLHILDGSDIFVCDCDCNGYEQSVSCTCGVIYIGLQKTENRNWNPDCVEHGKDSAWWNSEEQVEKRRLQSEQMRRMFREAREARHDAANRPQST